MKRIALILVCFIMLSSCEEDLETMNWMPEDVYYKIISFRVADGSIDLNNDGIKNADIFLEVTNYFNGTYNLQIKSNSDSSLLSFYFPAQNISYDYLCCPDGYVEFYKNGFTTLVRKNQPILESRVIDADNKIIQFSKVTETRYKLLLEKKYFDFSTTSYQTKTFEIVYDRID